MQNGKKKETSKAEEEVPIKEIRKKKRNSEGIKENKTALQPHT